MLASVAATSHHRKVTGMSPGAPNVFEIIPGGGSGEFASAFSENQLGRWLTNRSHALPFTIDHPAANWGPSRRSNLLSPA
jgi:acyl-homoserine lactone acylase PvdQ